MMRRLMRCAALFVVVGVASVPASALPNCNYHQLRCGSTCQYQAEWGGACSGTASSQRSYCWWELVQSDYGSWWASCQDGGYDVCCDEIAPN